MDNNTEEIRREAEPERGTKPRDTVKTSERVSVPLGAESIPSPDGIFATAPTTAPK